MMEKIHVWITSIMDGIALWMGFYHASGEDICIYKM